MSRIIRYVKRFFIACTYKSPATILICSILLCLLILRISLYFDIGIYCKVPGKLVQSSYGNIIEFIIKDKSINLYNNRMIWYLDGMQSRYDCKIIEINKSSSGIVIWAKPNKEDIIQVNKQVNSRNKHIYGEVIIGKTNIMKKLLLDSIKSINTE